MPPMPELSNPYTELQLREARWSHSKECDKVCDELLESGKVSSRCDGYHVAAVRVLNKYGMIHCQSQLFKDFILNERLKKMALENGIEDESRSINHFGLTPSYHGTAIFKLDGRQFKAIGHRSTENEDQEVCSGRIEYIEIIP